MKLVKSLLAIAESELARNLSRWDYAYAYTTYNGITLAAWLHIDGATLYTVTNEFSGTTRKYFCPHDALNVARHLSGVIV